MTETTNTFVWDQDFVTGIELVDGQHRALVDLLNRLSHAIARGDGADAPTFEAALDQLTEYAGVHFGDEVGLMSAVGLAPAYIAAHMARHDEFVAQVAVLRATRREGAAGAGAIVDFLIAWLGYHILGEDHAMARQIARVRAGESAEQAFAAEHAQAAHDTSGLLKAIRSLYQTTVELSRNLALANRQLEARVAVRTAELDRVNGRLREANVRLTLLSRTDGLLGIANRAYFDELLSIEWRRAMRRQKPVSLLLADLDHFKRYNDSYGHLEGDECLKAVAQVAAGFVQRASDLVARYGGEELVVLLPDTNIAAARVIAEAMCASVSRLEIAHGESPYGIVTVSIGVAAMVPMPGAKAEDLVAAADSALYVAKKAGRNRVSTAA